MRMPKVDELLKSMIAFETINSHISGQQAPEAKLVEFLEDLAANLGFETRRLAVPGQADELLVLYRQDDSLPWVLFDSHLDTVSVDGMTIEPFAALEKEGRIWGRGACDTKGTGAAMFTALCEYAEADREALAKPNNIALLFSVDEEWGMTGIRSFVETHYPALGFSVKGAIVGEPTKLETVIAHNGAVRYSVQTHGVAAHSCDPSLGKSAISDMARLILHLEERIPAMCGATHPLTGKAQSSINIIRGGTASNIIPDTCEVQVDRRTVPGEENRQATGDFGQAIEEFKAANPDSEVSWQTAIDLAPLDDAGNEKFIETVLGITSEYRRDKRGTGVGYGTHAGDLSAAGIPTVVYGPGDIAQAHTKDEWVDIAELQTSVAAYRRLMSEL